MLTVEVGPTHWAFGGTTVVAGGDVMVSPEGTDVVVGVVPATAALSGVAGALLNNQSMARRAAIATPPTAARTTALRRPSCSNLRFI